MSAEIYEAMMDLRALMFQNVYENPTAIRKRKGSEDADGVI